MGFEGKEVSPGDSEVEKKMEDWALGAWACGGQDGEEEPAKEDEKVGGILRQ